MSVSGASSSPVASLAASSAGSATSHACGHTAIGLPAAPRQFCGDKGSAALAASVEVAPEFR
eukprot:4637260-Amphidinium_carterae.1